MDLQLIVIQVIVVLVGVYLAITENKKNIYLITFLFNFTTLLMYIFNRDKAASISCALLTVRSFVYIYKDSLKEKLGKAAVAFPIVFMLLHCILGGLALTNPWQLLSIIAPILTTAYMWWGHNTQDLRGGSMVIYAMWATYEGVTGLYIVMISDIINALVFTASFIYHAIKQSKSREINNTTTSINDSFDNK